MPSVPTRRTFLESVGAALLAAPRVHARPPAPARLDRLERYVDTLMKETENDA